ncbi:hypothetical protein [Lacinutrix sp. MEBiC02404]
MKFRFVCFIFLFAFIGCSNDDNVEPDSYIFENIIGSWAYDTIKINGTLYSYDHTEGCTKDLFQFYFEEGKEFDFEEDVVLNCGSCAPCALSSTNLRWHLQADIIDLYFGEQLVTSLKVLEVDETLIRYRRFYDYDQDGTIDEIEVVGVPYNPYD